MRMMDSYLNIITDKYMAYFRGNANDCDKHLFDILKLNPHKCFNIMLGDSFWRKLKSHSLKNLIFYIY